MLPKLMHPHFECITQLQNPSPWNKNIISPHLCFQQPFKKKTHQKKQQTYPFLSSQQKTNTPPKINIEPENDGLVQMGFPGFQEARKFSGSSR